MGKDKNNVNKPTKLFVEGEQIQKVFTKGDTTFFLSNHGALYVCGYNFNGQGGVEHQKHIFSPVIIPFFQTIEISKVFCGYYHVFVLTSKNELTPV